MLSYLAFRAGVGVLGVLPRRAAVAVGEWAGRVALHLLPGRRRMAERHGRRLGVSEAALAGHVREVFRAYGRYWAETFWVRPRRRREIEATTAGEGLDHVRAAAAAGIGMIYALPHLGNWEYAAPLSHLLGVEVVAVAEDLPNRRIRDWFVAQRRQLGIEIVLAGRAGRVLGRLEGELARNKAVALLCDRDLRGRGVPVEFFGEVTTLPAGPVTLALRTGAPLLPVAAYFVPGVAHRAVVRTPLALPPPDSEGAVADGTRLLARELELLIREAPEQWHLLQPNWPSDRS